MRRACVTLVPAPHSLADDLSLPPWKQLCTLRIGLLALSAMPAEDSDLGLIRPQLAECLNQAKKRTTPIAFESHHFHVVVRRTTSSL